ncbi:MAG: AAA family ATPase [Steroidobacteraceae bacterium]|jgi:general secretion pathway protein A
MYTSFFGLSEKPFAITPDPRYLYLSERHAEALAHLLYGINESGGFIQLTGEVGTGKTTVVRTLLSRLPQHADVAVILNPRITPAEFLLTICEELGVNSAVSDRDSVKQMVDALNRRLLEAHAEGRRVIVIVDEAQNLSAEVLEQVRLLTNLETPTQKLLQIILIGQPELRTLLDRTDLRQLAQRITGRYHLSPLDRAETKAYVRHRLRVAGVSGEIFTAAALSEVHRLSMGIPRVINVCCDRALLGAYTQELHKINAPLVRLAASEVYGRRFAPAWIGWAVGSIAIGALAIVALGAWQLWSRDHRAAQPALASAPPVAPPAAQSPATPVDPATPAAAATAGASAATQPGAAAPPTRSLNALLAADHAADAQAYRELLALWGTAMKSDKDPCVQAGKAGLACFDQRGSWAELRMLDRPAILSLTDDQGNRHRVLLRALNEQFATLLIAGQSERIPLADVSEVWFGDFTVVWKPATRRMRQLSVGASGEEVQWLRRSLHVLHGGPPAPAGGAPDDAGNDLYDQDLASAVENFQREHRLNVDGIAGLQTQIVLQTALADPNSPTLIQTTTRGG